jgi:hypothetical protein
METGNGLTAEKMIAALEKANGYVSAACTALGCSRQHFYVKLREFKTVQQAMDEIREKRTDFVESKMMKLIDAENPTMIIFYLKTQAKNRGYIERSEVTGADGEPLIPKSTVAPDRFGSGE